MVEWKIRRRHRQCSACESAFDDGARHVSLLGIDDEEALVREDLCLPCWKGRDPADLLLWWSTHYREGRKKSLQLDLGSLERLFMELGGREEEKLRELRYLLCLLLMRKRKLKLLTVKRGKQGERLILRRPRRTEEIEVWVFDFTPEKIEELRIRLQEVLEGVGPEEEQEGRSRVSAEEGREPGTEQAAEAEQEGGNQNRKAGSRAGRREQNFR
jgi:hypothetical protein